MKHLYKMTLEHNVMSIIKLHFNSVYKLLIILKKYPKVKAGKQYNSNILHKI